MDLNQHHSLFSLTFRDIVSVVILTLSEVSKVSWQQEKQTGSPDKRDLFSFPSHDHFIFLLFLQSSMAITFKFKMFGNTEYILSSRNFLEVPFWQFVCLFHTIRACLTHSKTTARLQSHYVVRDVLKPPQLPTGFKTMCYQDFIHLSWWKSSDN